MHRRTFLSYASLVPLAITAGCDGKQPLPADQVKSDINLIASGLSGLVAALRGVPGVTPDTLTRAQALIDDIRTNAATISQAVTPNPDTVQAVANAVSALAALLTPFFPQAALVAGLVQAASALIPVVLALVGRPTAAAAAPTMTPAEARARLAKGTAQ